MTQAGKTGQRLWISNCTTASFRISLRDEIQFCYTKQDAFATVCSSRGGRFLDQIYLRLSCPPFICVKSKNKCERLAALDACQSVRDI